MHINDAPVRFAAAIIPAPTVMYGQSRTSADRGSWNLRGMKFTYTPLEVSQWAVVCFARIDPSVQNFIQTLASTCNASGLVISQKQPVIIQAGINL